MQTHLVTAQGFAVLKAELPADDAGVVVVPAAVADLAPAIAVFVLLHAPCVQHVHLCGPQANCDKESIITRMYT